MKEVFKGVSLSFDEQVDLLISRGLKVADREYVRHILENVSYSRLKGYMVPFMVSGEQQMFKPGTTFEDFYSIYGFDRRFRELIFHELEKVEISIRARIGFASTEEDGGYWFINEKYFANPKRHKYILRHLSDDVEQSDNDAIKRFRAKYSNEFPPCWMTLEAASMGTLSVIYDALIPGKMKDEIAAYYGLRPEIFGSWLRHLVYIRNVCAHHNRLWNNSLDRGAAIPSAKNGLLDPTRPFPPQDRRLDGKRQKVYTTLCVIKYLQDTIKPTNTFAKRLRELLDNYPQIDCSQMGFPPGWDKIPFWR